MMLEAFGRGGGARCASGCRSRVALAAEPQSRYGYEVARMAMLMAILLLAGTPQASGTSPSDPLPLSVELGAARDTVGLLDPLVLRITVTNSSERAIRIPTHLESWGVPTIRGPNGRREILLLDVPMVFTGGADETVLLPPGAWYGTDLRLPPLSGRYGQYSIHWTLRVPWGNERVHLEAGTAQSADIVVTVAQEEP